MSNTFFDIYELLSPRLNGKGEITTNEAWVICRTKGYSYNTIAPHFREIMNTMVEQKKAVKIKNGKWSILKPNTK